MVSESFYKHMIRMIREIVPVFTGSDGFDRFFLVPATTWCTITDDGRSDNSAVVVAGALLHKRATIKPCSGAQSAGNAGCSVRSPVREETGSFSLVSRCHRLLKAVAAGVSLVELQWKSRCSPRDTLPSSIAQSYYLTLLSSSSTLDTRKGTVMRRMALCVPPHALHYLFPRKIS